MRKSLVAVTALAALALSACGGGGNSATPTTSTDLGSLTAYPSITSTAKPTTIEGAATVNPDNVSATVVVSRNPSLRTLINKSYQPPVPKNTATIVQKANAEFGKAQTLLVPDLDAGTTAKAQVTLFAPKNLKITSANAIGFPEFGAGKDPNGPDDRAVTFKVTIKNTTTKKLYVGDVKINGTTNSKAPICRELLGGDGVTDLGGPVDPNTGDVYDLNPGESGTFLAGLVCQAAKGAKMSISFQVGTAKAKIYETTMP